MECPVCYEIFKNPLLLPGCGHTICQNCAELLVTEGNYLRCPECRLVYQLRRGVKSLPKNVALQRTIDEHNKSALGLATTCESHPEDTVSLYCKTCEKAICLKCYFPNTLRKGEALHSGHQVDTSEDVFSREKRLLEEKCREWETKLKEELDYIAKLEISEKNLKVLLEKKMSEIDRNKTELITAVKKAAAKLKFNLNGSIVHDTECLQTSLEAAKKRVTNFEATVFEAVAVLNKASNETPDITVLKTARMKLEELPEEDGDRVATSSFSKLENFDTDIQSCVNDPRKALSYQTESPRTPNLLKDDCIVSDVAAYIPVNYNETIRTKKLVLYYKEAIYKGMSEKDWKMIDVDDLKQGKARVVVSGLQRGTLYKAYAVAVNEFGQSPASNELWFRTIDHEIDSRIISK